MHTRFEINTIIVQFRKIRKSNKSRRNFSDTFFIYIYYIYIQTQIQDDTSSGISQLQKTYFFVFASCNETTRNKQFCAAKFH